MGGVGFYVFTGEVVDIPVQDVRPMQHRETSVEKVRLCLRYCYSSKEAMRTIGGDQFTVLVITALVPLWLLWAGGQSIVCDGKYGR